MRQRPPNTQAEDNGITKLQTLFCCTLHLLDGLDPLTGILTLLELQPMLHEAQQLIDIQRADELVVFDFTAVSHDDGLHRRMDFFDLALLGTEALPFRWKLVGAAFPDSTGTAPSREFERGVC